MAQKEPKRPRGRPRAYDPDEALARATDAFWRAGYSGTSLDALSDATGMNRPSLYGAFGDKHALYLTAVDHYIALGRAAMETALDTAVPLDQALRRLYDTALKFYFPPDAPARGCFLVSTAATEAIHDPDVRTRLGEGLRDFDRAFESRFKVAKDAGELDAAADPATLARVASAILHTLALRSRAGDSRTALRATAEAGIRLMCGTAPARKAGARLAGARKGAAK